MLAAGAGRAVGIDAKLSRIEHHRFHLVDLGKKHGFEVNATKDGRVFDGDLSGYDAFFFYSTGNLFEAGNDKTPPMTPKGKEALLAAVRGGKGLLGSHCASDSFHSPRSKERTSLSRVASSISAKLRSSRSSSAAKVVVVIGNGIRPRGAERV